MCPERDNGCEEEKGGDGRREMTKESGTKETKRTGACVVGGGREGGMVEKGPFFSGRAGSESGFTVVLVVQIVRVRDK